MTRRRPHAHAAAINARTTWTPELALTALAALALAVFLAWPAPAFGQTYGTQGYAGYHASIGTGPSLTAAQVEAELRYRLGRNPSDVTIWNTGYDFYRNYPRNQDTAMAIKTAMLRARAGATPEQSQTLMKAAIYWEKVHDYGVINVPVGQDESLRDNLYWGDPRKRSTLAMRKPVGGPVAYNYSYGPPSRYIKDRKPYKGRAANPYPGYYYPGVYPP